MKWVSFVSRALHGAGALLTILVGLGIFADVIGRLVFNKPFIGTAEVVAGAVIAIMYLQIPQSIESGSVLRVTFLYNLVGKNIRLIMDIAAYGAGAVIFFTLFYISFFPFLESLGNGEFFGTTSFRIPAWPLRALTNVLWLFSSVVCIRVLIARIGENLAHRFHKENEGGGIG